MFLLIPMGCSGMILVGRRNLSPQSNKPIDGTALLLSQQEWFQFLLTSWAGAALVKVGARKDRFPVEQPPPAPSLCVKSWTKCSTRLRCSSATTLLSGPSPFVNRPRLWPTSGGAQLSRSPRLKEAAVAFRSNAQRRFLRCHVSSWKGETGKRIQSDLGQVPTCVSVRIPHAQSAS